MSSLPFLSYLMKGVAYLTKPTEVLLSLEVIWFSSIFYWLLIVLLPIIVSINELRVKSNVVAHMLLGPGCFCEPQNVWLPNYSKLTMLTICSWFGCSCQNISWNLYDIWLIDVKYVKSSSSYWGHNLVALR